VARLQLDGAQLVGNRWLVISYAESSNQSPGLAALRQALPMLLLLAAAAGLLAVLYLRT
jgi:hypothetical protein